MLCLSFLLHGPKVNPVQGYRSIPFVSLCGRRFQCTLQYHLYHYPRHLELIHVQEFPVSLEHYLNDLE